MSRRHGRVLTGVYRALTTIGFDPRVTIAAVTQLPRLLRQYRSFRRGAPREWPTSFAQPCFRSPADSSGTARGHYFHQDLLVARRIHEARPRRHLDVGSRIDGFVAHVACFREIEVLDIRPSEGHVANVVFRRCDLMGDVGELEAAADSLSCLHALEHFGLGRYGDRIDPDGHVAGFANLRRIVAPGGTLYLSVPIGRQRVVFNAHRVFAVATVLALARPWFDLTEFSYVDDDGDLHESIPLAEVPAVDARGLDYGCGIFVLRRLAAERSGG